MDIANLNIGTRLGAGFGLLLILITSVAGLGLSSMSSTDAALHHIVDVNVKKMGYLEDMQMSAHIVSRVIRSIALTSDSKAANALKRKIVSANEVYNSSADGLEKMPLDEAGKAYVDKIKKLKAEAQTVNEKFLDMSLVDKEGALQVLMTQSIPINHQWQDAMHDFSDLQRTKNKKDEEAGIESYTSARSWMLSITVGALLAGITIAWLATRSITRPLHQAVQVAQKVAKGDLTSHIDVRSSDETGQLLQALKEMNASLANIVGQVRGGADTIATASSQIASGNLDLSSRTETQASSLEETASSMEEMTSTVKQNADNARQANNLAGVASEVANKGGAVVSEVVNTMSAINDSAKKIVDIISVIDGIAFQTNILALNAAVEAARAGEQGRGFAVVAAEVRNLAQRSAGAAKEIKTLISDSVEKVDAGSKLVHQAGNTMTEVVESVKRVSDIINEIAAASAQQTAGIEQINAAVIDMDNVTQQNAALVEEAAAAAGSMQDQAANLAQVVSIFKVDSSQTAVVTSRPISSLAMKKKGAPEKSSGATNHQRISGSVRPLQRVASAAVATPVGSDEWEEF